MTTIGATISRPGLATAYLVASTCTCGQDLDVSGSKHCPRCGITLHRSHTLVPAA